MKKFNYILLSLLCSISLVWTSCEEEPEYTPASGDTATGVYFPNTMSSTVNLDRKATSYDIEVCRGADDTDLTVAIDVIVETEDAGKITFPTSANFAKGSKSAMLTVTYELGTTIDYEDWVDVTLSIADEDLHSPYANSSYTFTIGVPAPYTKVVAANGDETATYREDLLTTFYGVDNLEYDLEIRENDIYPGIYRLMNPYGEAYEYNESGDYYTDKDYYLEIDTRDPDGVYINRSNLGCDWGYGEMIAWSLANYYMVRQGASLEDMKEAGYTGTLKDGVITFPSGVLLFGMMNYSNGGLYPSNKNGQFAIALPGYELTDYTAKVEYVGRFTDTKGENMMSVSKITLGEDVASAKVAMVKGDDIEAAIAGIIDESIASTTIEEDGEVKFLFDGDGTYSVVVVTYDADGNAKGNTYQTFEFVGTASKWESLGIGLYTDDLVTGIYGSYGVSSVSYEVEVEENLDTPGLYRIVNPYGAAYPNNEEGDYDASKKYYLEINACDPEGVYYEYQSLGFDWGYGEFYTYSMAWYYMQNGYDFETVKEAGYCGTLVDGVITFPVKALAMGMPDYGTVYANMNGAFKLVLPEAYTATATVNARSLVGAFNKAEATPSGLQITKYNKLLRIPNRKASVFGF